MCRDAGFPATRSVARGGVGEAEEGCALGLGEWRVDLGGLKRHVVQMPLRAWQVLFSGQDAVRSPVWMGRATPSCTAGGAVTAAAGRETAVGGPHDTSATSTVTAMAASTRCGARKTSQPMLRPIAHSRSPELQRRFREGDRQECSEPHEGHRTDCGPLGRVHCVHRPSVPYSQPKDPVNTSFFCRPSGPS